MGAIFGIGKTRAYNNSRLALVLFTCELVTKGQRTRVPRIAFTQASSFFYSLVRNQSEILRVDGLMKIAISITLPFRKVSLVYNCARLAYHLVRTSSDIFKLGLIRKGPCRQEKFSKYSLAGGIRAVQIRDSSIPNFRRTTFKDGSTDLQAIALGWEPNQGLWQVPST